MRKALACLAASLFFCTSAFAERVQWGADQGGTGHSYEVVLVPGGISWLDANRQAEALGGYLTAISTAAEQAFVFSLIDEPTFWRGLAPGKFYGPWIGAFSLDGVQWHWSSGEAFDYAAWSVHQPDFSLNKETKAHFWSETYAPAAAWNDLGETNTTPIAFVVEFD